MPFVTGQLVDQALQRVRDPSAGAHSRAFVRLLLTHLQRLVNARFGLVIGTTTFATIPYQQVYPITASLPDALRIIGVRQVGEGQEDLTQVKWTELWYLGRDWAFHVAARFQSFALIGRDLLIIYPAKDLASEVLVSYATLTATLTDDTIAIQLPDDYVPLLLDLTAVVLLLKQRYYTPIAGLQTAIEARLAVG